MTVDVLLPRNVGVRRRRGRGGVYHGGHGGAWGARGGQFPWHHREGGIWAATELGPFVFGVQLLRRPSLPCAGAASVSEYKCRGQCRGLPLNNVRDGAPVSGAGGVVGRVGTPPPFPTGCPHRRSGRFFGHNPKVDPIPLLRALRGLRGFDPYRPAGAMRSAIRIR